MPSFLDKSAMLKSSFNFHDIESHLSSSKISISDFKPKSNIAAPVALNLKRNYLWKKLKKVRVKDRKKDNLTKEEGGIFWDHSK